jgi:hypothetical protein
MASYFWGPWEKAPWYQYRDLIYICVIENGVTSIGTYAFLECSNLVLITISSSVTSIADTAFSDCEILNSIEVDAENTTYSSGNGVLFNKNMTTLVMYPAGKAGKYIIPSSVTSIGNTAFRFCQNMTSVHIHNDVTNIGDFSFYKCESLSSITIPNSITSWGSDAFSICSGLRSVTIQNGIENIGIRAFSFCSNLISVTIPNTVTTIEQGAFTLCTSLTSITIPESVTSIGLWAFRDCSSLTSITNLNPLPADISSTVFQSIMQNTCTLKVPANAVSAYQNAEVWKNFIVTGGDYYVQTTINNSEYGYAVGNELYQVNEIAVVTATAYIGYKFANWTKDGVEISTDNSYSFTVTEDIELVANFAIQTFDIAVGVNNSEYGIVTGIGTYNYNEEATLTGIAYSGYYFVNWTKNGEEISVKNPYSFAVTEDVALVANFVSETGIANIESTSVMSIFT